MKIQFVAFRRCFVWLGAGWYAFKVNLGAWLVLSILFLLVPLLLGMLPFVGILLIALFMPLLLAGLLITAHKSLTGGLAQVEDMLVAFNEEGFRRPLLLLGLMSVAATVLLLVALFPLSGEVLKALYFPGSETRVGEEWLLLSTTSALSLFLQAGVIMIILMGFFYATPLIVFEAQDPLDAVAISLVACLKNIVPLAIFTVMATGLGALALFAFGLGFLVLIPVLTAASYASFRDVFDPVEPADEKDMMDLSST